jgi:PmbA protein
MTPSNQHEDVAARLIAMAMAAGASGAEATVADGDEFEVTVRLGEVETLKEAGSRAAGLRVLYGARVGSGYTSDLSDEGLRRVVDSAASLARISTGDPLAGLPDQDLLGALEGDLRLYSDSVERIETARKIDMARECEAAALSVDPRIDNSEGASFSSYSGWRAFANSLGFLGSYRSSSCSLSVVPVAREGDALQRDYWFSSARELDRLESAASIGREAARRVLRRLGARKPPTARVPVVFDSLAARSLAGHIFSAVTGEAVWQQASFLAGKLGQRVAASRLSLIDDSTMPALFGTSPFDDEGVKARRTPVIEDGVLSSYLLNSYTARKLGMKSTGNASRGVTGNASTGHGNLYVPAGTHTPEDLIAQVPNGLFVTELLGSGVNTVNGDYSRLAAGLWIENGRLAWPVHEITVSGNLARMLETVAEVASDLEFRGSVACPTILIEEMTVSGT